MKKSILWALSLLLCLVTCFTACDNDTLLEENSPSGTTKDVSTSSKFKNLQIIDSTGAVIAECPINLSIDTMESTVKTRSGEPEIVYTYRIPNFQTRILSDKHYGSDCRWVKMVAWPVTMGYGKTDDRQVIGNLYLELTITGEWLSMKASNNFEGELWTLRIWGNNKWLANEKPNYLLDYVTMIIKDKELGTFGASNPQKQWMSYRWVTFTNHKTGRIMELYRNSPY